jgi:hypothetical protein
MIIESFVIGAVVSVVGTAVRSFRIYRESASNRQIQNIEFDRLMRSQDIHQTVAQARRAMVDEARRTQR